ncbi:MAG: type II toxin-antitoxin system HicB family antitoxin [Nanoarchaeota archaeon]|nr:type II toxin-antitoxin system HicB family antitoxin [Nanoarchaeota archaeon]
MVDRIELDIVICPEVLDGKKIYSISSVQVPGVVTQGETVEKAKEQLREALELYFEDAPESAVAIVRDMENAPMISRMVL